MLKKIFLINFVLGVLLIPATALADSNADRCSAITADQKVRAYMDEGIGGAGCEVFHITYCQKIAATAPLRCNEVNYEHYPQCANDPPAADAPAQPNRPPFKSKFIEGCKISGQTTLRMDLFSEDACTGANGKLQYKNGVVYGAWNCPADVEECEEDQGVIMGTVVVEEGTADEDIYYQLNTLNPQLGGDFNIGKIYEVGKASGDDPICFTGDYPDLGDTIGDPLPGAELGGTLDPWGHLTQGCTSVNSSPLLGGFSNPLVTCSRGSILAAESGTELLSQFIGGLYTWATGIVGLIAVLVMVISGIQISLAGGDSAKVDSAKTRIMESLAGLAILFLAGLILFTINPNFFT
jgi:hypothetical protein